MANQQQVIELQLDPARLSRIINRAVMTTSEIVNFHFGAIADADLNQPAAAIEQRFRIQGPTMNADQRRSVYEAWMLAKAFQELLRAVRHALEEAHVFVSLLTGAHTLKANSTFADFLKPFQSKAASLKFPKLLDGVNEKLDPKIDFAACYVSLQKARNCLEHRDGVVSTIETHGGTEFVIHFPRPKIYYVRDGAEVELEPGIVVDPGDDRQEVKVYMKIEARERAVPIGQRLSISRTEFNEIAFSCYLLGQQLSSKLPRPKVSARGA